MSKVYFYALNQGHTRDDVLSGIEKLFREANFSSVLKKNDFTAVKVHFGERENKNYVQPEFVSRIAELASDKNVKCFITDANTIYRGGRSNAVDHLLTAYDHGFIYSGTGFPVLISDGLSGKDYREISINGQHFNKIKVSSAAVDSDSMIVVTHFKGHMLAGFGGALKNVGMGLASRSGKQEQHSDVKPTISEKMCIRCFQCISACPVDAIVDNGDSARVRHDICIGCGECTVACRIGAIEVRWRTDNLTFQEKMIEYTYGILSHFRGKAAYMNFLTDISPHCDCMESDDPPVVGDIGLLASLDPVALDRASIDMVNASEGRTSSNFGEKINAMEKGDDKFRKIHGVNWDHQLKYAERLGVGSNEYELIEIR